MDKWWQQLGWDIRFYFVMSAGLDSSYFQQVRVGFPDKIEKGIRHGLLKHILYRWEEYFFW